jgi:hypothetical protein
MLETCKKEPISQKNKNAKGNMVLWRETITTPASLFSKEEFLEEEKRSPFSCFKYAS